MGRILDKPIHRVIENIKWGKEGKALLNTEVLHTYKDATARHLPVIQNPQFPLTLSNIKFFNNLLTVTIKNISQICLFLLSLLPFRCKMPLLTAGATVETSSLFPHFKSHLFSCHPLPHCQSFLCKVQVSSWQISTLELPFIPHCLKNRIQIPQMMLKPSQP